jgi:hypothetical protein
MNTSTGTPRSGSFLSPKRCLPNPSPAPHLPVVNVRGTQGLHVDVLPHSLIRVAKQSPYDEYFTSTKWRALNFLGLADAQSGADVVELVWTESVAHPMRAIQGKINAPVVLAACSGCEEDLHGLDPFAHTRRARRSAVGDP